ncbi:MAG: hypothetical protein WCS26_08930 [Arcobacteraceae bacterium]|jgi:hypothetical protein
MDLINQAINKYEQFCEEIVVPIFITGKELSYENELINPLRKFRLAFAKNKVDLFFQNLKLMNETQKLEFINNLDENKKIFFIETVNKIIDLNDNTQNYLMSVLTENYINNGKLNYFETKLYYNINTLSQEDFEIYYCIFKKYNKVKQRSYSEIVYDIRHSTCNNKEIINISLSRFSSLGILMYKHETKQVENFINLGNRDKEQLTLEINEYYYITSYSVELFNHLTNLFTNFDCCEILKEPQDSLDRWPN